jgi:Protein of unknown function (DUF3570)
MQLKQKAGTAHVRAGLMAATCALLAPGARAQGLFSGDATNTVDTGLLLYKEDQGRVQSLDAIVKLSSDFGDEHVLTATGAIDVLTGGSPNGAMPQKFAQTFTTPSGSSLQPGNVGGEGDGKLYTIAPGKQPLDPNFRDLRVAGDLNWSQPLGIGNKLALGGHLSIEHDFRSIAGNAQFSHDFNSKNTTLGAGLSAEFDQVKPLGGVPVAGSDYTLLQKGGSDNKHVLGAQVGVTQVLTRNWIAQLNFSMDRSGGYLNDPYKILSQVDANGVTTGYLYENRPGSRTQRSVWLGNKVALGSSVLDLSLRYGSDNWGIHSRTIEAHYRLPIGGSMYLEPHLRWYRQDAADFYRLYLTGADLPATDMSADPRLGAFTAKTIGLKLGIPLDNGTELGVRLEGYQQDPKDRSSALPGLSGLDLNPRLRAIMLQFDWKFGF